MTLKKEMAPPDFKTTGFGLLDVGVGRSKLAKYVGNGGRTVRVKIDADITYALGSDDGFSIEFALDIKNMVVQK